MYYLQSRGRAAHPTPAEAPYVCGADGLHEWSYKQEKHKAALKTIKGLVDQSQPKSIDPPAQRIQAYTRRFCEGQKQAEIGRDNRKLVERLALISKGGEGDHDARSPPNTLGRKSMSQPSLSTLAASSGADRTKSLNEPLRRKTQKEILDSNASLVRRILHTKGHFDRVADERDWKRHQRAGTNLRRMPEAQGSHKDLPPAPSRTLPSVQRSIGASRSRTMNSSAPLVGLDMLMLPTDLLPLGDLPPRREQTQRPKSQGSRRSRSGSRDSRGSRRSGGSRTPPRSSSPRQRRDDRPSSRDGSRSPRSPRSPRSDRSPRSSISPSSPAGMNTLKSGLSGNAGNDSTAGMNTLKSGLSGNAGNDSRAETPASPTEVPTTKSGSRF